jgi:hypothetical protein
MFKREIGNRLDDFRPRLTRELVAVLPHTHGTGRTAHLVGEDGRAAIGSDDLGGGWSHDARHVTSGNGGAQAKITPRNDIPGNVYRMADEYDRGWQDLEGPWDRLKWARLRWQRKAGAVNPKASHAAETLAIEPGTYRTYEREPGSSKHTPYDHQLAIQFGRKFRVSWPWLLTGEGTPFDQLAPTQERVVRVMAGLDDEQQQAIAAMVEAFARSRRSKRA